MRKPATPWIWATAVLILVLGTATLYLLLSESLWAPQPLDNADTLPSGFEGILLIRPTEALYRAGEIVEIEGAVEPAAPEKTVEIDIVDPEDELWASGEAELEGAPGGGATFSLSFSRVRDSDPPGIYLLKARYGGVQNASSFLVSTPSGLAAEIRNLRLHGMRGEEVFEGRIGDTVMITGSVVNLGDAVSELLFMVEVRDGDSNIVESGYVSTEVPPGDEKSMTAGWPANEKGTFTVYAYVKDDPQSRRIISNIATRSFKISSG